MSSMQPFAPMRAMAARHAATRSAIHPGWVVSIIGLCVAVELTMAPVAPRRNQAAGYVGGTG